MGVPARGVSGREGLPREAGIRGLFWADGAWCLVLVSREQTTERSPPVDGAQVLQVQVEAQKKNRDSLGISFCTFVTCPSQTRPAPWT